MNSKNKQEWYNWRMETIVKCEKPQWNELYKFYCDLIYDFVNNPDNYGNKFMSDFDSIDSNIINFLFNILCKGIFEDNFIKIGLKEYNKIYKDATYYAKDLQIENGLSLLGFSFTKLNENVVINYSKSPMLIRQLYEFAQKCFQNKSSGHIAFARCDLNEFDAKTKLDLDICISRLEKSIQEEIKNTDKFILGLKNIKLKRKFVYDKMGSFWYGGTISYNSDAGFSYKINMKSYTMDGKKDGMSHNTWWYFLPCEKGIAAARKKNDLTVKALEKIAVNNPSLADEIYDYLNKCKECIDGCLAPQKYTFNGKDILSCHGRMLFESTSDDFKKVQTLIEAIDDILGNCAE